MRKIPSAAFWWFGLLLMWAGFARTQTAVVPFRTPRATFTDPNGIPLAGGCVFTYQGGTSTPQATYTDYTGSVQNSNPVILDSTGSAVMWLAATPYKFVAYSYGGTNCATGSLEWTVDQVPGNSFLNGTISGATIENSTITGSAISTGTINNTPIGGTTPATGNFTTATAGFTNGQVNPEVCALSWAPSWCNGSDMGAWINAAFAACSNNCTVHVPAGTYSYSTTIVEPQASMTQLLCDPGTDLSYTGSADAFDYFPEGSASSPSFLSGCAFYGTASATAGVHVRGAIGSTAYHISVFNFTSADCIENEGSTSLTYIGIEVNGCLNGVHNVGYASTPIAAANNIHVVGGIILHNSQFGAYEDAAAASSPAGGNYKDSYEGVNFEANGTQASMQACTGCVLRHDTFQTSTPMTNQLLFGSLTVSTSSPLIEDNYFLASATVTNDVNLTNTNGALIRGNYDSGEATNFINAGAFAEGTFVEPNTMAVGTTVYTFGSGQFFQICQNVAATGTGGCNFPTVLAGSYQPTNKYVSRGATAAIAAQVLATTPAASMYDLRVALTCDTAVASATVTATIQWIDTSSTVQTTAETATCTTLGAASYALISQPVNVLNASQITVSTSVSGSPKYDLAVTVNQMTAN